MTEGTQNVERVEALPGQADVITDTIPAAILTAVEKYYNGHGYRLQSYTLVSAGTYEATFAKKERSV